MPAVARPQALLDSEDAFREFVEARAVDSQLTIEDFLPRVVEASRPEFVRRAEEHLVLVKVLGEEELADHQAEDIIDDFRLIRVLGKGGTGEVWEAEQISLPRRVALKLLATELRHSATARTCFMHEAEAAGRLSHDRIARIFQRGEHEGIPFIAQELAPAGLTMARVYANMRERVCFHPVEYFRLLATALADVADALGHAHRQGVVHRDVKPANILFMKGYRPKIVDFGLAESGDGGVPGGGTPYYMSPEQAMEGKIPIDHRTDVFSLGVTLYEGLAMQRPFHGGTREEILQRVIASDPIAPHTIRATVPPELSSIAMKCIAKMPDERYSNMEAVAAELRRFLNNEPILARPLGGIGRLRKWLLRNPAAATGGVVALIATMLIGLLIGLGI